MIKRYEIMHHDQDHFLVEDLIDGDKFFIRMNWSTVGRYTELPPDQADVYMEGFLEAVNWADSQLKHRIHNFIEPFGMVDA